MATGLSTAQLAEKVVAAGRLPESVQLFVASRHELREPFAGNSAVSAAAFAALYRPRSDARVAKRLCARPLPAELRAKVLEAERRPAVLGALLKHNELHDAEIVRVGELCDSSQIADRVLRGNHVPAALQATFLARATSRTAAWWLDRNPFDATDDDVETAVRGIVQQLLIRSRSDRDRHILVIARLCWLRPNLVPVVAELAADSLHAARAVAPLHLDAVLVGMVLDAAANVEAAGWSVPHAARVAECVLDRPDHPHEVLRRASALLSTLRGTRAASEAGLGSPKSSPYMRLPYTGPALRDCEDVAALWLVASDRSTACEASHSGSSDGFARAFQWADLACNPQLSLPAARAVAAKLADRRVEEALGAHALFVARAALHAHHPEAVSKPRRPSTRRRVKPIEGKGGADGSWEPPEVNAEQVAQRFVVGFVERWAEPVAELLCERLGEDPAAWHIAFDLAGSFEGTFGELADAAALMCAN